MGILSKLKNGDTTFRSLSYGKDRPNGGNSNAPYITTPLPGLDQNPGPPNVEDSILRGSLKAPISAKDDILRLTKYFFDIKNIDGYLFTTKQNILSRTAVKTEASFGLGYGGASKEMAVTGVVGGLYTGNVSIKPNNGAVNEGIYTPLSTILQAGVGYLGVHYNKQGLDPTGNIPTLSINKYQDVVFANNKSIPEDPKVPFSLIKKSQKANLKSSRKVSSFLDQQTKTDAELNANFQGLDNLPFNEFNQQSQLQKTISAFLNKWDQYLDKKAIKKLDKKSKAADDAIAQSTLLNNQVESAMNAPKVYTNRLLKLMDASGLNPTNQFESISSVLYSYGGGPDSTLGVGGTDIKFATKNDGITPSRTNIIPSEPFIRPQITYLLDNIFGDDSVSVSYTNSLKKVNVDVNEINLFSSLNYLSSYNSSPYFNSPWDTQDIKIIDSLRKTSSGVKVSYYQTEYSLTNTINNNPQIPITKDAVVNVNVRRPLGATNQFIKLYDNDNSNDLLSKGSVEADKNPLHQSWVSRDPITGAPLANKAYEEKDPYTESKYSQNLTKRNKTFEDSDLKFSQDNTDIDFTQYKGTTQIYNESGSILNPDSFNSENIIPSDFPESDPSVANASSITPTVDSFYYGADIPNTTIYHPSYEKTRREETKYGQFRSNKYVFPNVRHENRVGTGEPGRVKGSVTKPLDTINSSTVYSSKGNGKGKGELNDFVHFRIGIVDAKTAGKTTHYMNFRSYIDNFSDSFNANWTDIKYMGRGEPFKRYSDFGRTINMSFTIAATSQAEMYGIYDKLRFLATSVAPSYTSAGYMAGNFAKLTVGGYVFEQYGIITGFTYDIPEEASWDLTIGSGIALRDELPMMIKVTGFTFIPIYKFVPQLTTSDKFRWLSNNIPSTPSLLSTKVFENENGTVDLTNEELYGTSTDKQNPGLNNNEIIQVPAETFENVASFNQNDGEGINNTGTQNTNTGITNTNTNIQGPLTQIDSENNIGLGLLSINT